MNIEDFYTVDAHEQGAEMRVKNQLGKDTDFYITLIGLDSSKWADIKRSARSDAAKLEPGETLDIEQARIKALVQAMIGWRAPDDKSGKEVKFSVKAATELLTKAPYIRTQCDLFIVDRANFTKG